MPKSSLDEFKTLTFLDLEKWAGAKIVSRGKSYQKSGCVSDLGRTEDGRIIAWVRGTRQYATAVSCENGEIKSDCTCPYWDACKHAVAVILELLSMLKKDQPVPLIASDDKRLQLIANMDLENEENNDLEDLEEEHKPDEKSDNLKNKLKTKTKAELLQMIVHAAEKNPDLADDLRFNAALTTGSAKPLVQTIRKEIESVSSEPAWWNEWEHEGSIPDYSRIQKGFQKLLDSGRADEVVQLGDFLFQKGMDQVGQSDDDGETATEIESCLNIVFKALAVSSLPDIDKMEKAVHFELEDQYDLCHGLESFWNHPFDRSAYGGLADRLQKRLQSEPTSADKDDFHRTYRRDRLVDAIVEALQNAGRGDEVIPLCIAEAERTHSYLRVVRLLMEAGRTDEAEAWIRRGYDATRDKWAGIADRLVNDLEKIKSKKKDWPFVAAIKADRFFNHPSLLAFQDLKKAANKVGCWPEVRNAAMRFLEKGILPDVSKTNSVLDAPWPLPATGFSRPGVKSFQHFPLRDLLIEIAITEKKVDEVVRWYESYTPEKYRWRGLSENLHDRVASAVANEYPEKSIAIWKQLAEDHIHLTQPKEYMAASRYLKKLKTHFQKCEKTDEWREYMNSIRNEHARKKRLMEILDGLEGKSIYDS